jgi:hypothetical protein
MRLLPAPILSFHAGGIQIADLLVVQPYAIRMPDIIAGGRMGYDNRLDRQPVSKVEKWGFWLIWAAVFAIAAAITVNIYPA